MASLLHKMPAACSGPFSSFLEGSNADPPKSSILYIPAMEKMKLLDLGNLQNHQAWQEGKTLPVYVGLRCCLAVELPGDKYQMIAGCHLYKTMCLFYIDSIFIVPYLNHKTNKKNPVYIYIPNTKLKKLITYFPCILKHHKNHNNLLHETLANKKFFLVASVGPQKGIIMIDVVQSSYFFFSLFFFFLGSAVFSLQPASLITGISS